MTELEALVRYVEHVRRSVLEATSERQRLVRWFVLALAEAELARLERKEGATMEGKLFSKNAGDSLKDTADMAAKAFYQTPKLHGLTAIECQVHPAQVKELPPTIELNIDGQVRRLPVVGSGKVQKNCVHVCGSPPPPASCADSPGEGELLVEAIG